MLNVTTDKFKINVSLRFSFLVLPRHSTVLMLWFGKGTNATWLVFLKTKCSVLKYLFQSPGEHLTRKTLVVCLKRCPSLKLRLAFFASLVC